MKTSKAEKTVTIIWITSLILAVSMALMNQKLPSHIFSVISWVSLAAVIGVGVSSHKNS